MEITSVLVKDGFEEFPGGRQPLGRIFNRGSQGTTGLRKFHFSGEKQTSKNVGVQRERRERGRSVDGFLSRHSQMNVVRFHQTCSEPSAFHPLFETIISLTGTHPSVQRVQVQSRKNRWDGSDRETEVQTKVNGHNCISSDARVHKECGVPLKPSTCTSMYSRNPQTTLPAGHGRDYESDLSKTLGYLTIDPQTEGKPGPKFIGGFPSNYPQTPPKVSKPSPPPSLQPANGRVLPPGRRPSGERAFPVPMHVTPPPPVLYEFTPLQMPTPVQIGSGQSLTMKYAQEDLRPPVPPKDFPRKQSRLPTNSNVLLQGGLSILPGSDTDLLRPIPASQPCTPAKPGVSPSSVLDTPPIEKRKRGSSEPPSPSDEKKEQLEIQCSGQTKAGKRCTRLVKIGPPLVIVHPDAKDVERFCFQHVKDVFYQTGFYLKREELSEFIKFEGAHLSEASSADRNF